MFQNSKFKIKNSVLFAFFVILALGVFYWSYTSYWSNRFPSTDSGQAISVNEPYLLGETEADKASLANAVSQPTRYTNAKYGFSFEKPAGYSVGIVPDAVGETLVVQNTQNSYSLSQSKGAVQPPAVPVQDGFQIYITPLDESLVSGVEPFLTPARIQSDLPGTSVVNPLKIKLDNKADGLMFQSNGFDGLTTGNSAFGDAGFDKLTAGSSTPLTAGSYEIWFVYPEPAEGRPGRLYQITSYAGFAETLKKIIGTWKFQ